MEDPLSKIEKDVLKLLNNALSSLDYEPIERLDIAPTGKGDLAFPCFRSAAEHKRTPKELAEQLRYVMEDSRYVEKVVPMGPYLNFFITPIPLADEFLRACLKYKEDFGSSPSVGKRVIIEHTSANPTGPFHVGRARNPILGDSIASIMRRAGFDVETQYWVNDMGKQVVVLAYGLENCPGGESEREKADHVATIHYRQANALMEKDENVAREIERTIRGLEQGDMDLVNKVKAASTKVLEGMKVSLQRLNVDIDRYVWESRSVEDGTAANVVETLKGSDRCKEEEGAFYLDLGGLVHGRNPKFFFTRKDGTTLYTTRDVAYHLWKLARCDMAINILGEDHRLEAKQLETALNIMGSEKVPEGVFYAFVSLPSGCPECGEGLDEKDKVCPKCGIDVSDAATKRTKMSTRKGLVVYIDDLIDEAVARAFEVVTEKRPDLSEDERSRIADLVAIGALRYNIIRIQAEKSIVFKWDEALSFEGKSAPFIQYAHARACSILREAGGYDLWRADELKEKGEIELIKALARFPSVVRRCAEQRQAYSLAEYAHDVAVQFNRFYRDHRVIGSKTQDTRLAVVDATRWVLSNALDTLGIVAPESM